MSAHGSNLDDRLAGDVDYSVYGQGYAAQRRTDPGIANAIHDAIGETRTILNVGAGAGSYEPANRHVIPIEPSAAMRLQRPKHLAPAIRGCAEELPLDDQSVDAAMALVTVHQWRDLARGLAELKRVTRGPIVVLTFDRDAFKRFWLSKYAPELMASESRRFPPIGKIVEELGGSVQVQVVPIPFDCPDGFLEAYYGKPEAFLQSSVRRSQSAWSFLEEGEEDRIVNELARNLENGEWEDKFGAWREKPFFEGSLRLIVSTRR